MVYSAENLRQPPLRLACIGGGGEKRDDGKLVVEMVEHEHVAEEGVEYVGGIVQIHRLVFHLYILEIAHGVERRVAVESAILAPLPFYIEEGEKLAEDVLRAAGAIDGAADGLS